MKSTSFFSPRVVSGTRRLLQPANVENPLWAAYRSLDQTQWLSSPAVEQLQLQQVRSLLSHCLLHVPFYRRSLGDAGIAAEDINTLDAFRRIPVLQRRTYQEFYPDFQARTLPPDTAFAGVSTTSGTSGLPIEVMQTNVGQLWWLALYLRDLEWCGFDPRGTLAVIRPAPWAMTPTQKREFQAGAALPCWHPALEGVIETGPSHGMDIHEEPRRHLAWLRRIAPQYLLGYPSHLDFLGSLIAESGEPLRGLHAIQTVSEALPQDVQERIERAFGVPVKPLYSCGEAGYLASPCPAGHGLHVHAEHVILEVLDADGQPCKPGQRGRVVLTNLHNYLTPFIRYEIMDEATLGPEVCPCGRGLPLLARVDGKCRPLLRLPDGRVKHSDGLGRDIRYVPGLHQYQLVQRAVDEVLVRVVPGQGWTAFHPERIRQLVCDFFEGPVRVIVEERDRLELSPSGKLSDVVSEIKESTSPRPEAVVPGSAAGAIPCDLPPPHPRPLSPEYGGEGRREAGPGAGDEVTGKTVLLGWELGAGLGHIRPLLHLARALAARGFRPVLAVKAPGDAKAQLRDCSFPVLQAPVPQPHPELASRPVIAASYADILALHGYGDVAMLSSMVQAWQGLIDQVKPDLVVCDHCPTLCLTAYGVLPTVIVGNGFFVPPADQASFPLLLPGQRLLVPEGQLLATIWEVQRRRQLPAPETLPGLLGRAERFVTVLPEMDPYQARRTQPAVGPLEPLPSPGELPPRGTFFAYLHAAAPHFEEVLAGLSGAGFLGKAYVLGITPAQRERFRRPQLEILEALPSLTDVLPHAAVVVHQGSAGLGQHALAVGRPQLLYPVHLEHVLNSQMLHRLGVGHYMTGQVSEIAVAGDLRLLMADRAMAQRALSVANAIHSSGPWDPLPRIVDRCVALLQRACPSSSST